MPINALEEFQTQFKLYIHLFIHFNTIHLKYSYDLHSFAVRISEKVHLCQNL